MRALQILITQYEENAEILKPMLDSIASQQGVDLNRDVEVLIGNDGSDVKLPDEFLSRYSYPIRYLQFKHSGLPGCRANLFEASDAKYVMFCDADDMFFSSLGINTILAYGKKEFDAFASLFYEEIVNRKTGERIYAKREHDSTFVHGKVYRRQYLIDNGIVWHPELKGHEDSCFNILAQKMTKRFVYCNVPFYLWKWRDDSICRKDRLYIPQTYKYMIDSNEILVQDFLKRGDLKDAILYANSMLYGAYYTFNKPIWYEDGCEGYLKETEARFREYYKRHRPLLDAIQDRYRKQIINGRRRVYEREGNGLERFTFAEWLKRIKKEE